MTRGIGQPRRLFEQLRPFLARQTVIVPVGARMFAAVVEEADIVVRQFQRPDLGLDERVELVEIRLQAGGYRKLHVYLSLSSLCHPNSVCPALVTGLFFLAPSEEKRTEGDLLGKTWF